MKLAVVGLIGIAALGWAFRYETVDAGLHGFYQKNRWTGTIYLCNITGCRPQQP